MATEQFEGLSEVDIKVLELLLEHHELSLGGFDPDRIAPYSIVAVRGSLQELRRRRLVFDDAGAYRLMNRTAVGKWWGQYRKRSRRSTRLRAALRAALSRKLLN